MVPFQVTARELSFVGFGGMPMLYAGDWMLMVDGLNATLTVDDSAANATSAKQRRYRQDDWAAISGQHGRSDGDGWQRNEQRLEGFSKPQQLP